MSGMAWLDDEVQATAEIDRLTTALQEARAQQAAAERTVHGLSMILDGIGDLHPSLREHLPELDLPPTGQTLRRRARGART